MPLPLIPIIAALAAGGTLVPHAAGGMIVTSTAGYIAGTYLSTAAIGGLLAAASTGLGTGALYLSGAAGSIGGLLAAASTGLGAGALYLSGAADSIIGSAGIFDTTVGASGITGALMSVGIISATPIWVPLAISGAAASGAVGLGYGGYRLYKLKKKISNTAEGEEAQFTENEAKIIGKVIKRLGKKESDDDQA